MLHCFFTPFRLKPKSKNHFLGAKLASYKSIQKHIALHARLNRLGKSKFKPKPHKLPSRKKINRGKPLHTHTIKKYFINKIFYYFYYDDKQSLCYNHIFKISFDLS
ncbi:hypothetical protein BJI48_01260 [Helicobacter sp. 11S02596-1]|nr:hypothetical protein BJI48_01260 [Helicobacter sp. 11S02596-1]